MRWTPLALDRAHRRRSASPLRQVGEGEYLLSQSRDIYPTSIRHGLHDSVRPGDLLQFARFAFEIIELLAVGLLRPGLFEVEIHVDSRACAIRWWHEIKQHCAQQCAYQCAQHPETPGFQQADKVVEEGGEKSQFIISPIHH